MLSGDGNLDKNSWPKVKITTPAYPPLPDNNDRCIIVREDFILYLNEFYMKNIRTYFNLRTLVALIHFKNHLYKDLTSFLTMNVCELSLNELHDST